MTDPILRRNKMLQKLCIAALILVVVLKLIRVLDIRIGGEDFYTRRYVDLVIYIFSLILMVIGIVAVYVLWTPRDGEAVKRPKWQFALLLVSVFVPLAVTGVITVLQWNVGSFVGILNGIMISQWLSILGMLMTYAFLPLLWTMLIMLLIKCERQAKKIMTVYIVMYGLSLIETIVKQIIWTQGDMDIAMQASGTVSIVSFIISIVCLLLIGGFTLAYIKGKIDEAKMMASEGA